MAAGLGFKTFTVGEVLSAADVNGYLMQGVLVFATTAARDAAITSPQEGQFAFTKDTNSLFYYDGAAWVASGATGDIEGVTAGTGISGGGTSGTVTVTNSMATAITTNGDLIYGTGSGTFTRRAIGSTGNVLTVAGGIPTWAAPASSLQILQIVQATYDTETASTSGTLADTGLTASITPASASNKILVLCTQGGLGKTATSTNDNAITMQLNRAGTDIVKITGYAAYTGTNLEVNIGNTSISYLDAPNTTSATIYKTRFKREGNGGSAKVQIDNSTSVMTLLEITGV